MEILPFEQDKVKEYLDNCIFHWRKKRDDENDKSAVYYIDAFQSMRVSLFGETLPPEELPAQP